MTTNNGLNNINNMYKNLTYYDQYGASLLLFIIITIILAIFISYCFVKINAQPIINDWPNQRCKPYIIPFAGYITHPEGVSARDYTYQNFNYCTQNILAGITGIMTEPLTFITNILQKMLGDVSTSINSVRAMFNKIRTFFQTMAQDVMGRIMNIMIELQKIIISFKDLIAKTQGTLTASLFTFLGSYLTLQSLMGAIAQFIIIILIILAAMIIMFWAIPFTIPVAIANTVIFVAIAIPMAIILAFMTTVLKVRPSLRIPSVKCFDENTIIPMNDGNYKKIKDIKVGDLLKDNNEVTGFIKVATEGSVMYILDGVVVSDSHKVKYRERWINVSEHPDAEKYENYETYNKPYLYCLNTNNKTISINSKIFSDWDELNEKEINILKNNAFIKFEETKDIHTYLDGGFVGSIKIKLNDGSYKDIKRVCVGDILENGEKVYGLVEINGKNVNKQNRYFLGDTILEGGPNLCFVNRDNKHKQDNKFKRTLELDENSGSMRIQKMDKLYHLLTDKKTFNIGSITFYDYNSCVDLFLKTW